MSASFLAQAVVYLAAAVIMVPIAQRLRLGSVLGYLIAGIVIGPFALGLVGVEGESVMHFAEFGVVMMLFVIGLELEPARLWRLRGPILGFGGLQVLLTAGAFTGLAVALGFSWKASIAIGLTLSLSSTAIVLQTLAEKGLLKTTGGQTSFAVLLFQDIAVIPMLALVPLLAVPGTGGAGTAGAAHADTWIAGLPPWAQTLAVLGAVGAIVVGGQLFLRPVFRVLGQTRLREIFTAASLLLVAGIAMLMMRVGLSPALGTFLAGVVLANSEYRHELESDIEPFKGLLLGLFFIAVGASLDFGLVGDRPLLIAALVAGVIAIKFAVLFALTRLFRMTLDQGLLVAFGLPQVGEFAFVLLSFASQEGVLGTEVVSTLVAVVALSMAVTPILFLLNERLIQPRFGTRQQAERRADDVDEQSPVLIAGFGSFGSTVGRLLQANGIRTTVLDNDADRVEVLRHLGLKVYYGDATRRELLHAAGADHARLIVVALSDAPRTLQLVDLVRRHYPSLRILARAFDWDDAHALLAAGAHNVYREGVDTSLRLGRDALQLLGVRAHHAHRAAQKFLRHDEQAVRALTGQREDRRSYLSAARQHIQDLERMLRADLEQQSLDRDDGWDPETLRDEVRARMSATPAVTRER